MHDLETIIRLNNEAAEREANQRKADERKPFKSEYDKGYSDGYDSAEKETEAFYKKGFAAKHDVWSNQWYNEGYDDGFEEGRSLEQEETRKAVLDLIRTLSI